jgi:ketosteroid isomerase-like protein
VTSKAGGERCAVSSRVFEAYNAGDLNAMLALLDPDVELNPLRSAGVLTASGRDEVAAIFRRFQSDGWHTFSIREVRPLPGDRVLVTGTVVYADDEMPFAGIHTVRDGRIVMAQHYFSDEATLASLGALAPRPD